MCALIFYYISILYSATALQIRKDPVEKRTWRKLGKWHRKILWILRLEFWTTSEREKSKILKLMCTPGTQIKRSRVLCNASLNKSSTEGLGWSVEPRRVICGTCTELEYSCKIQLLQTFKIISAKMMLLQIFYNWLYRYHETCYC